jgi:hypothetical protein
LTPNPATPGCAAAAKAEVGLRDPAAVNRPVHAMEGDEMARRIDNDDVLRHANFARLSRSRGDHDLREVRTDILHDVHVSRSRIRH